MTGQMWTSAAHKRLARRVVKVPVQAVLGVREDGQKVLLLLQIAGSESTASWRSVTDDLARRGLAPPVLVVVDGNRGLSKAIRTVWRGTRIQRCTRRGLGILPKPSGFFILTSLCVGYNNNCGGLLKRKLAMTSKKSNRPTRTDDASQADNVLSKFALGNTNLGVSIRDKKFNLTYQNPLLIERFGNRLGEHCHEVFHGTKERCPDCPAGQAFKDGKPCSSIRKVASLSTGSVFWENTAVPMRNDAGKIVSCLEINRDVTDQKNEESKKQLRIEIAECVCGATNLSDLIGSITDRLATWVGCDAIGIRLQMGDDFPYFETRGFPQEFVLAENNLCEHDEKGDIIFDGKGHPLLACMCGNIIGGRFDADLPFFTEGGSFWSNHTTELLATTSDEDRQARTRNRCNGEGYESVVLIPLGVGSKKFGLLQLNDKHTNYFSAFVVSTMEEIAHHLSLAIDRQVVIDESAKARERFKMIADFTYDWEMAENSMHELIYVSPASERITGYRPDRFMDDPYFLSSLIIAEDRELWDEHRKITESKQGLHQIQLRIKNKNGEIVWIEHACQPVVDAAGGLTGWRSSNRDISDRIRLQDELSKRDKLQAVGVLAGGLAHDFNNILGGVVGYISLAMSDVEPNGEAYRLLASAERATLRAAKLTQKLLTFSKGDEPIKEAMSLPDIVRESAEFTLSGSNVIGHYHCAEDMRAIQVDGGQISQVVQNLTLNACQSMPDGGVLEIRIEMCSLPPENSMQLKAGDYSKLIFRDQGKGIPDDIKSKIFDPFFSTKPEGSGLGLATCYSIVNKHGGHIEVDSSAKQGSTFTIYLPAIGKTQSMPSIIGTTVDNVTVDSVAVVSGRILVMDDDACMREVAAKSLTRVGYIVECAKNTPEAVTTFKDAIEAGKPFDLVLLDLTIRGENGGKQTVRLLQEMDSKVKALVFSGYSNDPVLSDYEAYGFCGVVRKPFVPTDLVKSVGHILYPDESGKNR